MHTLHSDPVGLKYRCHWSPPLAIDWFDNSVYFGCQVIFRSRDRGQNWGVSTAPPPRPKSRCHWSPPLAIDWFDNSVYFGCQVIFRSRDRGQTWDVISPDL